MSTRDGLSIGMDAPTAAILVTEKLNSDNYREWSRSMLLALEGRGKLEYVTGEVKPPSTEDAKGLKTWKSENSLVSSWLLNGMTSSIRKSFMYLPSAQEIWVAVKEAYTDTGNRARIFDLKTKLWQVRQDQKSLNDYYLEKSDLWQELDAIQAKVYHCKDDAKEDSKNKEEERVFELLAGLNIEYDDTRARILQRDSLPSVRETYAILRNEEGRRKSMLHQTVQSPEPSALATRSKDLKNTRGRPFCDHCKKQGHTKTTCWDLHGKPADWKPKQGRGRSYIAEAPKADTMPSDQLNKILEMLATLQQPSQQSQHSVTVTEKGKFLRALTTIKGLCHGQCWIIDSGASDHMTDDKALFISYSPLPTTLTVRIADDSSLPAQGIGSIKISAALTLHSVLYVPNLKCNLLSVSKLASNMRCHANFFATHCVFQDLLTGTTIGSAKECDGLYYL